MISLFYIILSAIALTANRNHRPQTDTEISSECQLSVGENDIMYCNKYNDKIKCSIRCDGEYEGIFTCSSGNVWYTELPFCVEEVKEGNVSTCTLKAKSGFSRVSCKSDEEKQRNRTVCAVSCLEKFQGAFVCTPEYGWHSELPSCAKKVTEVSDPGASTDENHGCPDEEKCTQYCVNLPSEFIITRGECTGPDKTDCRCLP